MSEDDVSDGIVYDPEGLSCSYGRSGKYPDGVWKEYSWEIQHMDNEDEWIQLDWDGREAEPYLDQIEPDINSLEAHRRMGDEDEDMPDTI